MKFRNALKYVKSLYHVNKIRFTDAGPEILGQEVLIVPKDLFVRIIKLYESDPVLEDQIYQIMKRSVYQFCESLDDDQELDRAEMLKILMKLGPLNGYGHIEISEYDEDRDWAAFFVRNLPSKDLEGDYQFKGDTYWAGMLAGGMSYVLDRPVDGIETQCVLEDNTSCRFVVAPAGELETAYPELYADRFKAGLKTSRTPQIEADTS